jgi:hypothetical protein
VDVERAQAEPGVVRQHGDTVSGGRERLCDLGYGDLVSDPVSQAQLLQGGEQGFQAAGCGVTISGGPDSSSS